jgi:hypothetical protein
MNSFRAAFACKLFILIAAGGFLVQSYRLHSYRPSGDSRLHNIACTLLKGGFKGRVVSERQDGLLIGAIYLTQTELDDNEIRNLVTCSNIASQWRGTVKIIYDPNPISQRRFNNDGSEYRYGPFLLFGDKELIDKIAEILSSGDSVVGRSMTCVVHD